MARLYSPVFTGVCLSMMLATYSAIAPGWPVGICLASVVAVAIISLIISVAALVLFVLDIPNWVKYLLLFCLVTQWHVPWALLRYHPSPNALLELMAGGVAYFFWPVLGVFLGRNIGRYTWFSPFCWILSILLLLSCFFLYSNKPMDDEMVEEYENIYNLRRRAEADDPEACYELAEAYRYGASGLKQNAAKAFFYHTRASELGELESTYVLAFEYLYYGRLTELNPAKGAQLLKTVAEAGFNSDAMFWYAVICVNALGVPRDLRAAHYWVRRCLENSPRHPSAPGLLVEIEEELGRNKPCV